MATVIFVIIGYYLMMCTMHGNLKVGIRFLSFTFYPLKPHETMINSFVINAMLMNSYMYSLTYYITDLFSPYMRGTQAAIFFQVITKNMKFYGWFFKRQVFNTLMIIWILFITAYFVFIKPRVFVKDNKNKEMK